MKEKFLQSRRNLLVKSGKGFAAALGLAAFAGAAGRSEILATLAGERRASHGFPGMLGREAAEMLTFLAPATCNLTCGLTLGPCYVASAALVRRDITSGQTGLPMRLGFRIVNAADCSPVTNATVDVWHTNASGIYSATTSQVCTNGANVSGQNFCRGVQSTDGDGYVFFDSIFPGWYSSRTTHIHFTIRVNNTAYVTSQFAFADRVSDFIYRKHPLYNGRALRTTNNTNDSVFSSAAIQQFTFDTRYKSDQLQAFKTIAISSTSQCSA